MSEVRSTFRLKIGDLAPDFSLPEPDGVSHALAKLQGAACNPTGGPAVIPEFISPWLIS